MAKWETFQIIDIIVNKQHPHILFATFSRPIPFEDGEEDVYWDLDNKAPFNTFKQGDYVEIDVEKTQDQPCYLKAESTNIIRFKRSGVLTDEAEEAYRRERNAMRQRQQAQEAQQAQITYYKK